MPLCAAGANEAQPLPSHVLQQEYELVKNAFYTEPHDQSSWLYLRWLIGNSLAGWEKAKGTPQEASATQVRAYTILMLGCHSLNRFACSCQAYMLQYQTSILCEIHSQVAWIKDLLVGF